MKAALDAGELVGLTLPERRIHGRGGRGGQATSDGFAQVSETAMPVHQHRPQVAPELRAHPLKDLEGTDRVAAQAEEVVSVVRNVVEVEDVAPGRRQGS